MNNIAFYEGELSSEDMKHLYEKERLIRSEISTMAGLLLKSEISTDYPGEEVMSELYNGVNTSLAVLHRAMFSAEKDCKYRYKKNYQLLEGLWHTWFRSWHTADRLQCCEVCYE